MDNGIKLSPEAQFQALMLLSLDCLVPHWPLLCLPIPLPLVNTVNSQSKLIVQGALGSNETFSSVSMGKRIAFGLRELSDRIMKLTPSAARQMMCWIRDFIGDDTQAKIDWRFQMVALDIAKDPRRLAAILVGQQKCESACVLVESFRTRSSVGRISSLLLMEKLSEADQKLLEVERLPLGDVYLYPTLELADEIAARVDFLHVWRDLAALTTDDEYQSIVNLFQEVCKLQGGTNDQTAARGNPNISVCHALVS